VYLVLAGTTEGLTGLRALEGTCSVEWSFKIVHCENLSLRWRRGCRESCSNLEKNLPYFWLLFFLSQLNSTRLTLFYFLHAYTCSSLYAWHCLIFLYLFKPRK